MAIDVVCPVCGSVNKGIYPEESGGWVECSCCKSDFVPSQFLSFALKAGKVKVQAKNSSDNSAAV